jgi:hypothetical protein
MTHHYYLQNKDQKQNLPFWTTRNTTVILIWTTMDASQHSGARFGRAAQGRRKPLPLFRGGLCDPDDENWQWKLFPERTSIEYTPEFDHIADETYESRYHIRKEPKPELRPGISGYDLERILAEEEDPPPPQVLGGLFGDYIAGRRKITQWKGK